MKWPTVYKTIESSETPMEQGTVVLSLDVELLWGYLDILDEHRFSARYPNAMAAYDHVLRSLCNSGVSATWMVVGGMALNSFEGPEDGRVRGLPEAWRRMIPAGNEITAPLWFRRAFIRQVISAHVPQEIGLHGGFSHLIWTDRHSGRGAVRAELSTGMSALHDLGVQPRAFSFPRNMERYHSLLAERAVLGATAAARRISLKGWGGLLQATCFGFLDEAGRACHSVDYSATRLPGLWNAYPRRHIYTPSANRAAGLWRIKPASIGCKKEVERCGGSARDIPFLFSGSSKSGRVTPRLRAIRFHCPNSSPRARQNGRYRDCDHGGILLNRTGRAHRVRRRSRAGGGSIV